MNVIKTEIPDVLIFEPKVLVMNVASFESFNQKVFEEAVGRKVEFVQDNHSKSKINVLRGMHYQTQNTQGKLVRVISGSVYDVAVDLREKSKTFGKWVGVELSGNNKRQLWIPEGFAHGFMCWRRIPNLFINVPILITLLMNTHCYGMIQLSI